MARTVCPKTREESVHGRRRLFRGVDRTHVIVQFRRSGIRVDAA